MKEEEARSCTREKVKEIFGDISPHRLQLFTEEEWDEILKLIRRVEKSGEAQVVAQIGEPPPPVDFSIKVVAPDWAGLLDAVVGAVHHRGYNIDFVVGLVTKIGSYGIVHTSIVLRSEKDIKRASEDMKKLLPFLKAIAQGTKSIQKLLNVGTKKLEIYENIVEALRKMTRDEEFKELVKEDGEVERFTLSRSEAYLEERTPEILAEQILTNYRFQEALRERGRGIYVKVRNIETVREKLTCVSVAGYEQDLSLDDLLDEVREYLPNFQRKYDKQFITDDGISVIRLEIADREGRPLDERDVPLFERHLKNRLARRRLRESVELKAGSELFGRVLIPRLLEEAEKTGVPQLYLLPVKIGREEAEFKMAIVAPLDGREPGEIRHKLMESLSRIQGLMVASAKPPSVSKGIEINILTLTITLAEFGNPEDIYDGIKKELQKIFPKFRDFDEGMRKSDREKLQELLQLVEKKGIEVRFARKYFYGMDDFYRLSAPVGDLLDEIEFAHSLLLRYLREERLVFDAMKKNRKVLLAIVGPAREVDFRKYLNVIVDYEPLLTQIEEYGATLVVFNLRGKKVPDSTSEILEKISSI